MLGTRWIRSQTESGRRRKKLATRHRELFAFRLAEVLGYLDPDEMTAQMTPELMDRWIAKDRLEPIGVRCLVAQLASFLAMFAASKGVDCTAEDYMPGIELDREQSTEEQIEAARRTRGAD
jgi:hypothetical protein